MSRLRVLFFAAVPNFKGGAARSLMDLLTNPGVDPFLAVPAEGPIGAQADTLGIPWTLSSSVGLALFVDPLGWLMGLGLS